MARYHLSALAVPLVEVQSLLPAGLSARTFDGSAWVSLTALRMGDVGPPGLPRGTELTFAETHLRTYVPWAERT